MTELLQAESPEAASAICVAEYENLERLAAGKEGEAACGIAFLMKLLDAGQRPHHPYLFFA